MLWPPDDMKSQLIRKDLYDGKDRRQERKGVKKDDTVRWHELEKAPEDGKGQGKPGML